MESNKHCYQRGTEQAAKLLRLVADLMSSEEDSPRLTFDRVKIEGGNVGAEMHINRGNPACSSDPADQSSGRCVNVYINNNIQGVSSSILVGSEVTMADPGLSLSLGDVSWGRSETDASGRSGTSVEMGMMRRVISPIFWLDAVGLLVCAFVLVFSILSALFWPQVSKKKLG